MVTKGEGFSQCRAYALRLRFDPFAVQTAFDPYSLFLYFIYYIIYRAHGSRERFRFVAIDER